MTAKERYAEYLAGKRWRKRRNAAIKRAGGQCSWCQSKRRLQVHHRSYRRIGRERPKDLIVLCSRCHEKAHGLIDRPPKEQERRTQTIPDTGFEASLRILEQHPDLKGAK